MCHIALEAPFRNIGWECVGIGCSGRDSGGSSGGDGYVQSNGYVGIGGGGGGGGGSFGSGGSGGGIGGG